MVEYLNLLVINYVHRNVLLYVDTPKINRNSINRKYPKIDEKNKKKKSKRLHFSNNMTLKINLFQFYRIYIDDKI